MSFRIGIGSWADYEYVGVLYPKSLPPKKRLEGYAQHFNHVEVNSSYYATPKADGVRRWIEQTPDGFSFSIKLHRAFAQSPQATATKGVLVDKLLSGLEPLIEAQRLAALLLVLPPTFAPEKRRLEELDTAVEKFAPHPIAVELRHSEWVSKANAPTTLQYFRERGLIWVAVDMPKIPGSTLMPAMDEVTYPKKAYMRLHGRNPNYVNAGSAAEGHHHAYTARELADIAKRARGLSEKAETVYVIANNHSEDLAPRAALALVSALKPETPTSPAVKSRKSP